MSWLTQINGATLRADAFAGAVGAAVVLPQGVAFAAIAGLPPEYGIYTAIVTPIVAALFGSSMIMVSGPTTAISAVVFSALAGMAPVGSPAFIQNAIALAFLVGLIQFGFALARVGRIAGFVSHSVMVGFTAAAAVHIAMSQIGPAIGLDAASGGVVARAKVLIAGHAAVNGVALTSAGLTILTVIVFRRWLPRWPGFLIALGAGSLAPHLMAQANVDLRLVGTIPPTLPVFSLPALDSLTDSRLIESAFAIALIGLLEAIAIGRSLSYKTGGDFSSNREILGQGLSNIAGGLFQCYPASGSFTRSALNLEAGARTPLAAIFSALFLAMMAILLRPLVALIPICAVAGLILYVAWRLLDFHEIGRLFRSSRVETGIVALTFLSGVVGSLELAIYIGALASLALFLDSSSKPALVIGAPDALGEHRTFRNAQDFNLPECPRTLVLRFDGPIFFGSVDFIAQEFRRIFRQRPKQTSAILILKGVGEVDHAGAEALMQEISRRRAIGGDVLIVASYPPLVARLKSFGLIEHLGADRLYDGKRRAIARAVEETPFATCAACAKRVFQECADRPRNP